MGHVALIVRGRSLTLIAAQGAVHPWLVAAGRCWSLGWCASNGCLMQYGLISADF
jgi:hypothetical protein